MEEEYQGKLNTYGNDSILFVKDCTQTNGAVYVKKGYFTKERISEYKIV